MQNKYYLITGGLGGLGLKLIEWMIEQGAKKFIVSSRNQNPNLPYKDNSSITIKSITSNLLDYNDLNKQLEEYTIDGVFHLAGTTIDKMAKDVTQEDVDTIMNVKMEGINNLGKIFNDARPHRFFVAFSSIVALIGNPGQSVYSGANSYMDMYCQQRSEKNLPALSINLGAIGGCGMIQNDYNLGNTMLLNGINFTIYHDLFNSMKKCLFNKHAYQVCITDQNWNNLSHLKTKFIFNNYISTDINNTNTLDNNITELKLNLINYIKNLLGIEDDIDLDANLVSHGVDSIVAMDISNWCKNNMNININQIDVLQDITINEILSRLPNVVIKQDTDIKKNVFFYDSLVKYSPEENVLEDFSLIYYIFGFISIILSLLYLIW